MSLAGLATELLWVRLTAALVVGFGVPWAIAGRLTRDDPGSSTPRFVSVLSLCWLAFGVAFVAIAFPWTQPLMLVEAERLEATELPAVSAVAGWVAREQPTEARSAPEEPEETTEARREMRPAPLEPRRPLDAGAPRPLALIALDGGGASGDGAPADGASAEASDGSPEELERPELSVPELVVAVEGFLVTVSVAADGGERSSSGFVVDDDTVVTCRHVVEGARSVAIRLADGSWVRRVTLRASDEASGLALLGVRGAGAGGPAAAGVDEESELFALGSSLGLEPAVTVTHPSGAWPEEGGSEARLEGVVARGALCGPVVNRRGEVVGLALPPDGQSGSPVALFSAVRRLVAAAEPPPARLGGAGGEEAPTW